MAKRKQAVWLRGEYVGELIARSRTDVSFEYDPHILTGHGGGIPLLSCSLQVASGRRAARAFFAGLLPEGDTRRVMAQRAGCLVTDVFSLLERYGQDVAGAVAVGEDMAERPEATVIPYTDAGLAEDVEALPSRPLALYDDSELSLPGVQNKMLIVQLADGRWGRPVHGFPSTHILKIDDAFHDGLVAAEHTCLQVAAAAGLPAAASRLERIGDRNCIIVERFDRQPGTAPAVRIHQEDTCQALGIDADLGDGSAKYQNRGGPSLSQVAGLLAAWGADPSLELTALLDHLAFTIAIGDADAHGKNISLLHPTAGTITLAPLYDTVPTDMWPKLKKDAAMSIAGVTYLPQVTVADIVEEAFRWGVPRRTAEVRVLATLEQIRFASIEIEDAGSLPVTAAITQRVERLLSGSRSN